MRRLTRSTLAALLVLAGCSDSEEQAAAQAPPVEVVRVEGERVVERIQATGDLIPREEATVAAEVPGLVTRLHVDEGDSVARGVPLLEIDPERRRLELASRQARVEEAEAALADQQRQTERVRELSEAKIASDAQRDQGELALRLARSRLTAARAELGLGERALRDATVLAPFDGLVARRHVSQGEYVAPGSALVDLVALDPIEVSFHVTEIDSARVSVGGGLDLRVATYPDESFQGRVISLSPGVDPRTRMLRVRAIVPNADGRLRPGFFARVDLGISEREGVATIPEDAVLQRADGAVAFRLVGEDRVERRRLRTGAVRDGRIEVLEGLAVGDTIVVRGQTGLVDGSVVAAKPHGRAREPDVASPTGDEGKTK
ncbi:MAG: efflux RND transporter periplasmic adaptor subunit [Deltaproteobacteria bacterium]|nr:efflux RND transporter periplasmic adaptor subunit [Deltaproteobacteria bacterium]